MLFLSILSPALALVIVLIYCIINRKKGVTKDLKRFAIPMGMVFGAFGYSLRFATENGDLFRYFEKINSFSSSNFGDVIANNTDGLYVSDALMYFVSKCQNNYILPFIVGFLIYSIVFYVLFDVVGRAKKSLCVGDVLLLSIIAVGVISPSIIISNTRCILSYVLVTFAAYRDIVQKKRNILTFLLYLIPIGIHLSSVVIIAIRLLNVLYRKIQKRKWVILSIIFLMPTIIDFCYEYIAGVLSGPVGEIVAKVIEKAHYYLHWTSGGWATEVETSTHSKLIKIFGTIFIIFMIYILFKKIRSKTVKEKTILDNPMACFLFLVSIFALGCLHIKTGAFWRFESIVVLFSSIILVQAISLDKIYRKYFYILAAYVGLLLIYNTLYMIADLRYAETMLNFITFTGIIPLLAISNGIIKTIG